MLLLENEQKKANIVNLETIFLDNQKIENKYNSSL